MFKCRLKTYQCNNQPRGRLRRAQVAIELIVGVIVIFLMLYGMLRIFFYYNTTLVKRQKRYNATRAQVMGAYQNFYKHHEFRVFPQEGPLYEEP